MQEVIRVENLVQMAGKKAVLDKVSFSLNAGESFGLFGIQGVGKTSLLHIIAGIEKFSSGVVTVLGFNVAKTEKYKKDVGLVTQAPSLFRDLSGEENLDFIAALKGAKAGSVRETVERLDLEGYLKMRAGRIEPGAYKRLSLACALLGNPRVLLVDDLGNNLDLYSLDLILGELQAFHDGGGTSILVFSQPELAAVTDRVGWLENGAMTLWEPDKLTSEWKDRVNTVLGRSGGYGN